MRQQLVTASLIATFVLALTVQAHAGDFTFTCVRDAPTRLPACPSGCEVRLYRFAPGFVEGGRHKRNWHRLLFSSGLFFPKGGFVVYQPTTGTCLIASTADDLDLIVPLR